MGNKKRIVEVAKQMFFARGIRAVRMDDIARECGISKRTLYEIFSDREELIEESLCSHASERAHNSFAVLEGADNVLHAFWLVFSSNVELCGSNTAIIFDEIRRYYPKVMERLLPILHEEVVSHTREKLAKGVSDGLIMPSLDLDFFARALTNYVYGLGVIEENTSTTGIVITERTVPSAVLIFLRGISTEKGRRYIDENLLNHIIEK